MILLRLATLYLLLAAFFAVTGILACFAFGLAEAAVRNLSAEFRRLARKGGRP